MTDRQRPDGSEMIQWGWVLISLGALLLLIGLVVPTFSDPGYSGYLSERAPTLNPWKWPLIWLGIGLPNLGVVVLLVGHVVRAIWFLPGREAELAQSHEARAIAASQPVIEARARSAEDEQDATVGKAIWIVTAVVILGVIFFIVIIGGRGSSPPAPTNFAIEDANTSAPVIEGGDQDHRLREGR